MDNLELKLLQIDQDIVDAEDMLKALKEDRALIENQIIEQWSEIGTTKTTINGRTIYIKRSLQINPTAGREGVIRALSDAGMTEYLKEDYNTNSLKSYITGVSKDLAAGIGMEPSIDEIKAALPDELAQNIDLFEKYQVVTRKS
jgi:predicted transcriptional regulator